MSFYLNSLMIPSSISLKFLFLHIICKKIGISYMLQWDREMMVVSVYISSKHLLHYHQLHINTTSSFNFRHPFTGMSGGSASISAKLTLSRLFGLFINFFFSIDHRYCDRSSSCFPSCSERTLCKEVKVNEFS